MSEMKDMDLHIKRLRKFCKQEEIQSLLIFYDVDDDPWEYIDKSNNTYTYGLFSEEPTTFED